MRRIPAIMAILYPVTALATPAVAQDYNDYDTARDTKEVVKKLNNPEFQDRIGDAVGAMMSMKIGGVAEAASKIDPESDIAGIDPDATVGDIVSRGDPYYAENMADKTRVMARSAGVMASGMARVMPVMIDMARDVGAQMEKSVGREIDRAAREIDKR